MQLPAFNYMFLLRRNADFWLALNFRDLQDRCFDWIRVSTSLSNSQGFGWRLFEIVHPWVSSLHISSVLCVCKWTKSSSFFTFQSVLAEGLADHSSDCPGPSSFHVFSLLKMMMYPPEAVLYITIKVSSVEPKSRDPLSILQQLYFSNYCIMVVQ